MTEVDIVGGCMFLELPRLVFVIILSI